MRTSEEIDKIADSLVKFQSAVESPKKTSDNPAFKRDGKNLKYADLDAIIKTITPALSANGLSQHQFTDTDMETKAVKITTMLLHESGQHITSDTLTLPADSFGKFNAQTIGSAITYGRRYSLSALLGIASEDDDDANNLSLRDGKEEKPKPATAIQIKALTKEIERMAELASIAYEKAEKGILTHLNIAKKLKDITNEEYGTMLDYINKTIPVYEKKAAEKAAADTNAEQVDMKMQYNIPEK